MIYTLPFLLLLLERSYSYIHNVANKALSNYIALKTDGSVVSWPSLKDSVASYVSSNVVSVYSTQLATPWQR
jgi:hypothetical protein